MSQQPIDDRQQVIADLQAARDVLVARGRTRGRRLRENGTVCALGAVAMATVEDFETLYLNKEVDESGSLLWCRANPRLLAAEVALARHVDEDEQSDPPSAYDVAWFNDDPKTTDADVLNLFNKALAELGGLA